MYAWWSSKINSNVPRILENTDVRQVSVPWFKELNAAPLYKEGIKDLELRVSVPELTCHKCKPVNRRFLFKGSKYLLKDPKIHYFAINSSHS